MAATTQVGVELVVKGSKSFFGTLDQAGSRVAGFGKKAAKMALAGTAAVAGFGAAIAGVSISAAVDFESAFAGVIKTTDGLVDEFGNLTVAGEEMQQQFRALAKTVPTTVEELLAIGELGGQLGIASEDLVGFTRTIADMGESTNMTTEAAATAMAQFANVMGTTSREGVEGFSKIGSAIVALGNDASTTEADIMNFAQRVIGAGKTVGLTEAQVLGFSTAFAQVGVNAEAGGSAVSKVLNQMHSEVLTGGDGLENFAAVAGMSADDFSDAWKKDAGGAFEEFILGLGAAGEEAGLVLDELGLKDMRVRDSFLRVAASGEEVTRVLGIATSAFEDNTALTAEAEARYRTTAAQFDIFKNILKDVAITIGQSLLPFVNKLLEAAKPLITELGEKLPAFLENSLIPAIQGVVTWLGEILPVAFQFLSDLWITVLQPALTALFEWLAVNIPLAIQTLTDFWTGTLQPALQVFWEFMQSSVIPVLVQIAAWLGENIPVAIQALSEFFTGVLVPAIEAILPVIQGVIAWVVENWPAFRDTIVSIAQGIIAWVQENWPLFQSIIEGVITTVRDVVIPIVTEIATLIIDEIGKAVAWVQENWPLIQEVISDVLGTIQEIVLTVTTAIQSIWTEHGATIMDFARNVWNIIKSIIEQANNAIRGTIQAILFIISGNWEEAWNLIKTTAENIWNAFVDFMKAAGPKLWTIIRNIARQIPEIISSIGNKMIAVGGKIVDKLKEGIANAWDGLVNWFKDRLKGLTNLLPFSEPRDPTSPLHGLFSAGQNIINNIAEGIKSSGRVLPDALDSIFSGIVSGMRHFTEFGELLDIAEFIPEMDMSEWMKLPESVRGVADRLRNDFADIVEAFPSVDFAEVLSGFDEALRHYARYGETLHLDEFIDQFRGLPAELRSGLTSMLGRFADFRESLFGVPGEDMLSSQKSIFERILSPGVAAPSAAQSAAGTTVSVTNTFDTNIYGGMSQAAFETHVQRIVERAIGQIT